MVREKPKVLSHPRIDLAKLRARMRLQSSQTIYSILDDALDLLPSAKLEELIGRYLSLDDLRQDVATPKGDSPDRLRTEAEAFAASSRRGDYFDSFDVNSKNCTEQSPGTMSWIAECNRLLDRCVALASRQRKVSEVVASFELLFDLIDDAGSFEFDIIFFADEGGVYEFGIQWQSVMDAWFECFARQTTRDGSYDQRVAAIIELGGQIAGEAHQCMAQTVSNRRTPRSTK